MTALQGIMDASRIPARVIGEPPMFEVFLTDRPIESYRDLLAADDTRLAAFNAALFRRGILKSHTKYYVSIARGDAEVEETIAAWRAAAAEI